MARASNPFLKPANEKHEYTLEELEELDHCASDPEYFIMKYCKIQHPVKGSIPFELYGYQKRIVDVFMNNRLSIALAPRQIGKSWIAGAFLLWYAAFHSDQTILIASNKNANAMEMIHRVRYIYERLPRWLKPGLTADGWNKHSVSFDNESRIISQATTTDTGRGMAISLLFFDEFAFVPDNIADEVWGSVSPTLSTGGRCIICSTPNGDTNQFAQLWRGANIPLKPTEKIGGNGFMPIEIKWNEPPGRDDKFKDAETAKIGATRWLQEYECKFISSDPLLFDPIALENLTLRVAQTKIVATLGDTIFFKQPTPKSSIIITVDPSSGSGSDFTGIEVFEFPALEQVAEFRSNVTSSGVAYHYLKQIIKVYEKVGATVYYTVENNGLGEGILALMEVDENPPNAVFISDAGTRPGVATTGKTKIKSCLMIKELIERDLMIIRSDVLVREMKNFVRKGGSYAAKRGATDDLIMACVMTVRVIEEMATYDQHAYNKLYVQAPTAARNENTFEYENTSDYDDDPMPFVV